MSGRPPLDATARVARQRKKKKLALDDARRANARVRTDIDESVAFRTLRAVEPGLAGPGLGEGEGDSLAAPAEGEERLLLLLVKLARDSAARRFCCRAEEERRVPLSLLLLLQLLLDLLR